MPSTASGRPIVVGIDGSAEATEAAVWAAGEAVRRGVPLRLVAVWHVVPGSDSSMMLYSVSEFVDESRDSAREHLDAAVASATAAFPAVQVTAELVQGPAARTLLDCGRGAALLVIGSSERTRLDRLVFGSVTTHVTAHAPCPVVVVRPPVGGTGGPVVDGPVVVGIDGSEAARLAAEFGYDYAEAHGVELVALNAIPPNAVLGVTPTQRRDYHTAVEQDTAALVSDCRRRHPAVSTVIDVVEDDAAAALANRAKGASLLVVGSHGKGAFRGMLLGSVSTSLAHRAPVTTAIVRPRVAEDLI